MFCNSCGSVIPDGNSFCSFCGAPAASPASGQPMYYRPVQNNNYRPPVYQQPAYRQPAYSLPQRPRERTRINGFATSGLIFGIISLCFCWLPFVNFFLALFGLTFSIVGMVRRNASGKGRAIAGLVMSGITVLIGIIMIIALVSESYYY